MLPVSGAFVPAYVIPEPARDYLILFPLVGAVEYFHDGYYGSAMKTYYHLDHMIITNILMTFFSLALMKKL